MIKEKEKSALTSGQGTEINIKDPRNIIAYLEKMKIPLKKGNKTPDIKKGDTWQKEFEDLHFKKNCNYGLRLGYEFDIGFLIVIDYDSNKYFEEFLKFLQEKGISTDTTIVKTGGKHNGYHLYYFIDDQIESYKTKFKEIEVEIRSKGQYVVIPPSKVNQHYKVIENNKVIKIDSTESFFKILIERTSRISKEKMSYLKGTSKEPDVPLSVRSFSKKPQVISEETLPYYQVTDSSSYLVTLDPVNGFFCDITLDLYLFLRVLNLQYPSLYSVPLTLEDLYRNILCIFHKESLPSARIIQRSDGSFVYKDFHYIKKNKAFNVVEIFHAIKHNKEPEFLSGQRWTDALLELFEWISLEKIDTIYLKGFNNWWSSFEKGLNLYNNKFSNYIRLTLQVVIDEFRERMRKGHNQALLSKRYVADKVNFRSMSEKSKGYLVNRCMNFLVFSGLLRKGDLYNVPYTEKKTGKKKMRPTYYYSIDFTCSPEQINQAFDDLLKNGITTYHKFCKRSISRVYGPDIAGYVFRAKDDRKLKRNTNPYNNLRAYDGIFNYGDLYKSWGNIPQKTGGIKDVSNKNKEKLPDVDIESTGEQPGTNNRDTNESNKRASKSTTTGRCDDRRIYDRSKENTGDCTVSRSEETENQVNSS